MGSYDASHFDPPAPTARVRLSNPLNGVINDDVMMLIDTGADLTLLPHHAVDEIGAVPSATRTVEAFDRSVRSLGTVQLELTVLGQVFRGHYLVSEEDYGILGRDILNHFTLVFDGPSQEWRELAP